MWVHYPFQVKGFVMTEPLQVTCTLVGLQGLALEIRPFIKTPGLEILGLY